MQNCLLVQFRPVPSKELNPCKIDSSCKSYSLQNCLLMQKCTLVQKCLRAKKTLCANLSSCNFVLSCKNGSVQFYLRAVLCTRAILFPRAILYARAFLTATHFLVIPYIYYPLSSVVRPKIFIFTTIQGRKTAAREHLFTLNGMRLMKSKSCGL